jgi:hypothetical protein
VTIYTIRVKGHLNRGWSEWFDGLEITSQENGEALLREASRIKPPYMAC